MIKAHFSGRLVSSGISDVVYTLEKTRLKKLMKMMMIIIITEKPYEKGDVGMAKHFSIKYRNKG